MTAREAREITAVEMALLQPQQGLVTRRSVDPAREGLQGALVRREPLVPADGVRQRVEGGLGFPLQRRRGARRGGRGKAQQPVPGGAEGLQALRQGGHGGAPEGLRQARRLALEPLQPPRDPGQTGLQVRLQGCHGLPHARPGVGGGLREGLPLRHRGVEQRLGLRRHQRLQRLVPHVHERHDQRRQGIPVVDVERGVQRRPAGGGKNDVEGLGDHVAQLRGLDLGPRQPVVAELGAGFVEPQGRPRGPAASRNDGRRGPAVPVQRIHGAADVAPRVGEIRFQGGAPEAARDRLQQLPVRLDLVPGGAQRGTRGVQPRLDRRDVQGLQEGVADDFPRLRFDVPPVVRGLVLDAADVRPEAGDSGVDVAQRVVAQEGAGQERGGRRVGDAGAGRCPAAQAEAGGARPHERQHGEDKQAGGQGATVRFPQRRLQRRRHPYPGDGVLELADRRGGPHDVRRRLQAELVQRKEQRHQEERREEQTPAAQEASNGRAGAAAQVAADQQGGERRAAGNRQTVCHDSPSRFAKAG